MNKNRSSKISVLKKKITNPNAKKTVVKKLKSAGVAKCRINNIRCHTSAQRIDDCDSRDQKDKQMNSIISDRGFPPPRRVMSQLHQQGHPHKQFCVPITVFNSSRKEESLNVTGFMLNSP